jgi:excisionase family DNA binding protein
MGNRSGGDEGMRSGTAGRLLTADDVAGKLKVPRSWVYRAARVGDLPSVRCGRYRRFDESDVERWIARQKDSSGAGKTRDRTRNSSPSLAGPL